MQGTARARSAAIVASHCAAAAAPFASAPYTPAASASEANHLGAAMPSRTQKCPTATNPTSSSVGAGATPSPPPPPRRLGSKTNIERGAAKCAAPS